jgi:4-hydroxy-3-methylbut-2-enyl diphosphate reductase IspH
VPKAIPAEAERREMFFLDATCPLVSKVHREAEHHHSRGRHILMIGHAGHPEVIGTMGQLPAGAVTLVEDEAQARAVAARGLALAFITQTTPFGGRNGGDSWRSAEPLSRHLGPGEGGHLLRHPPTARRR